MKVLNLARFRATPLWLLILSVVLSSVARAAENKNVGDTITLTGSYYIWDQDNDGHRGSESITSRFLRPDGSFMSLAEAVPTQTPPQSGDPGSSAEITVSTNYTFTAAGTYVVIVQHVGYDETIGQGTNSEGVEHTYIVSAAPNETWTWEYWWTDWYATSGWSPDPSTVPNGQAFTQYRDERRDQYGRERSNLGNIRNDNTFITHETRTVSQGAVGTQPPAQYNSISWSSFATPSARYPSTAVSVASAFANNGTKPWGGNHYATIRDASYNWVASISTNGIGAGGNGSGTFSWTAPANPGSYFYTYQGVENGVEWFNASGSFTLNVAARPTGTLTPARTTMIVGQSVDVSATFSVDTARGDTLSQTAILGAPGGGGEGLIGATGTGNITRTFSPTVAGNHTVRSYLTTGIEPGWVSPASALIRVANPPTATITADNATITLGQSTMIRANYTVDSTNGDSLTYTAINHLAPSASEVTVAGYGPGNLTCTFTPSTVGTHVFKGYVWSAYENTWNTPVSEVSVTVIDPSTPTTFSVSPTAFTYNGAAQGPTVTPNPSNATYALSGTPSATNAGSYSVTATATGTYTGTSGPVAWTINPANQSAVSISPTAQTVAAGQSINFTASGGATGYTWGGSAGASGSGSTKSVSFPSAGTYTVTVQAPATGNYNASNVATATITVTTPTTFSVSPVNLTYNGAAQGPTITPSPAHATYVVTGTASATNVGAYVVTATATGSFSGTSGGVAWNINPATQTVTVSPSSQTIVLGGSINFSASGGLNGYTWGGTAGASGSGATKSVTFNSLGTYTVTAQSPAGGNYAASNIATATITVVNPATLGVTGTTDFGSIRVWTGSPLTASQVFTLSNTGGLPLTVSAGSTSGDYAITAVNGGAATYPFAVPAGGTATVTVTFNATTTGTRPGSLSLTNNSSNLPAFSVALTGVGAEGVLNPSWSSIRTQ